MSKSDDENYIDLDATVISICRDKFTVLVDDTDDMTAICTCSGRMRIAGIKILAGDKVKIKLSAHDPTKGRIVFRSKE